jgi:hypothetical protein
MSIFNSESTEIETSTPLNSNVDKGETENVTNAHPWY